MTLRLQVKRLRAMLVARGHDTAGAEEALLVQSMAEVNLSPNPTPTPTPNPTPNPYPYPYL